MTISFESPYFLEGSAVDVVKYMCDMTPGVDLSNATIPNITNENISDMANLFRCIAVTIGGSENISKAINTATECLDSYDEMRKTIEEIQKAEHDSRQVFELIRILGTKLSETEKGECDDDDIVYQYNKGM